MTEDENRPCLENDDCQYEFLSFDFHDHCPEHRGKTCTASDKCKTCERWTQVQWLEFQAWWMSEHSKKQRMKIKELQTAVEQLRHKPPVEHTMGLGEGSMKVPDRLTNFMEKVLSRMTDDDLIAPDGTERQFFEQIQHNVDLSFEAFHIVTRPTVTKLPPTRIHDDEEVSDEESTTDDPVEDTETKKLNSVVSTGIKVIKSIFDIPLPKAEVIATSVSMHHKAAEVYSVYGNKIKQLPLSLGLVENGGYTNVEERC